ncbi:MAG: hypothetical protein ABUT20_18275 [Bacteroidota bacterium]
MKKIFVATFIVANLFAQAQITETVTVKAGEDVATVLSSHGLYKFPSFKKGIATLKDGSTAGALMNFNVYLNEIQFIDPKGDTLAIADPATIDSITIDTNLFYYKKGYLQVVANYNAAKLVMKQKISFIPVKIGAYGAQSPGASIDSYGILSTPLATDNHLTLNQDIVVKKETIYSLIYKKYRDSPATHAGFLSVFPDNKKGIDDYIAANKIDFKKESDLKKLLLFCIQQP